MAKQHGTNEGAIVSFFRLRKNEQLHIRPGIYEQVRAGPRTASVREARELPVVVVAVDRSGLMCTLHPEDAKAAGYPEFCVPWAMIEHFVPVADKAEA